MGVILSSGLVSAIWSEISRSATLIDNWYLIPLSKKYKLEEKVPDDLYPDESDLFDLKNFRENDGVTMVMNTDGGKSVFVNKIIWSDLYELAKAYKAENWSMLMATSWYRSFEKQAALYADYKRTGMERYSTPAWTSEHHLGTAIDFWLWGNAQKYEWLAKNSYKYGFVLSFPQSCTQKTWVAYESWHFRWIGKDFAGELAEKIKRDKTYCPIDYYRRKTLRYPQEIVSAALKSVEKKVKSDPSFGECLNKRSVEPNENMTTAILSRYCEK